MTVALPSGYFVARLDVVYVFSSLIACGTVPGLDLYSQILSYNASLSFLRSLTVRVSPPKRKCSP